MRNNNQWILLAGMFGSLLVLILLAVAHSMDAAFMSIDSKWLIVSGIPLLVALIGGGYIKKFKGMGIELEVELQSLVRQGYLPSAPEFSVKGSEFAERADGVAKESLVDLYDLTPEQKKRIKRLSFVMHGNYVADVIEQYFQSLPALSFLEVRDRTGALACILPRQAVRETSVKSFVDSLAEGTICESFADAIVDKPVRVEDSFLVAIEKLRNSGLDSLPVLDKSEVVGLLDRSSAFERLAAAVVEARLSA